MMAMQQDQESFQVHSPALPKGGGAIRSIGDGLGTVGARGSAFGMGWSKTVNGVSRRTARGVPAYTDAEVMAVKAEVECPSK